MNLTQEGCGTPAIQATAKGGAASTPGAGPQLTPLYALTDEEPQRLDDLDRWRGWSSGADQALLELIDDAGHQLHCLRSHARLPLPKAWETDGWLIAANRLTILAGFWKPALNGLPTSCIMVLEIVRGTHLQGGRRAAA